jgi:chromosome partitioning protein
MGGSARIFAVANQKGGVGKTTTAVNLAACVAAAGRRVLLVDTDPQGNASSSLGMDKAAMATTLYDVLLNEAPAAEVVRPTRVPRLDLLPSTSVLAAAEIELVDLPRRETFLRAALGTVAESYDFVFVDCPPSLGLLTVNALTAAHGVLIPIQCEFHALEGLLQLVQTVDRVKRTVNPTLDVTGVVKTMYDARTRLAPQVVAEVRRFFPTRNFKSVVPRTVRLAEAPSYGQAITEYDTAGRGAQAYRELANELLERLATASHPAMAAAR